MFSFFAYFHSNLGVFNEDMPILLSDHLTNLSQGQSSHFDAHFGDFPARFETTPGKPCTKSDYLRKSPN